MDNAIVKIWDTRVGILSWNKNTRLATFKYDPKFINHGWNISPIWMPVQRNRSIYRFPKNGIDTSFKGLPGLFSDVLPHFYNDPVLNSWYKKLGKGSTEINPVEMLCLIGNRGLGALEFEPMPLPVPQGKDREQLNYITVIGNEILKQQINFSVNIYNQKGIILEDLLKVQYSVGAETKALIAFNESTGEIRSGQINAPHGFTHWLIKFDVSNNNGSNKIAIQVAMAYYLMSLDCDIKMSTSRLLNYNGRIHFMTRRFDRAKGNKKLHIQSWCALSHTDFRDTQSVHSYQQLFQFIREHGISNDLDQLYRRMVFNVLAKNCDDHSKNFTFIMNPIGKWELSPAYDISYSDYPGRKQHLSVNGKVMQITLVDLLEIASKEEIKGADQIIQCIKKVIKNWKYYAQKAKVPEQTIATIAQNLVA